MCFVVVFLWSRSVSVYHIDRRTDAVLAATYTEQWKQNFCENLLRSDHLSISPLCWTFILCGWVFLFLFLEPICVQHNTIMSIKSSPNSNIVSIDHPTHNPSDPPGENKQDLSESLWNLIYLKSYLCQDITQDWIPTDWKYSDLAQNFDFW